MSHLVGGPVAKATDARDAVLSATRALLHIPDAKAAAELAGGLVSALGGSIVAADADDPNSIPLDVSLDALGDQTIAIRLFDAAELLGAEALGGLDRSRHALVTGRTEGLARTKEDLVSIVQFLAAAVLTGDTSVFLDFLDWYRAFLTYRGISTRSISCGLDALRPGLEAAGAEAVRLVDIGHRHLNGAPAPALPTRETCRH